MAIAMISLECLFCHDFDIDIDIDTDTDIDILYILCIRDNCVPIYVVYVLE